MRSRRLPARRPVARSTGRAPLPPLRLPRGRSRRTRRGPPPGRRASDAPPVAIRVVPVAVVRQDDRAGTQPPADPTPDLLCRYPRIRIPHAERPSEHAIAESARGRGDERIAITVRGAERARRASRHVPDDFVSPLELFTDRAGAEKMQLAVPQGVIADLVTRRDPAA